MRDPDKFITGVPFLSEKYDVYLDFRVKGEKGDEHSWEVKVRTPRFMELFKKIYDLYRKCEEGNEEDGDGILADLKAHIKDLEEENKSLHNRVNFLSDIHYGG